MCIVYIYIYMYDCSFEHRRYCLQIVVPLIRPVLQQLWSTQGDIASMAVDVFQSPADCMEGTKTESTVGWQSRLAEERWGRQILNPTDCCEFSSRLAPTIPKTLIRLPVNERVPYLSKGSFQLDPPSSSVVLLASDSMEATMRKVCSCHRIA